MPKEARIVAAIRVALREQYGTQWYGIKIHGDQYTVNQPDILGCLAGRCVAIECKLPGKHARPGQLAILRKWRRAGAIVIEEGTSAEQVLRVLQNEFPETLDNG